MAATPTGTTSRDIHGWADAAGRGRCCRRRPPSPVRRPARAAPPSPARLSGGRPTTSEVPGEQLGADREGAPQPSLRWPQRADVEVGDEQPPPARARAGRRGQRPPGRVNPPKTEGSRLRQDRRRARRHRPGPQPTHPDLPGQPGGRGARPLPHDRGRARRRAPLPQGRAIPRTADALAAEHTGSCSRTWSATRSIQDLSELSGAPIDHSPWSCCGRWEA
jgi:hypothetical protein